MSDSKNDWVTLHYARYSQPVTAETQKFSIPEAARYSNIGLDTVAGTDGMPLMESSSWGAIAIYDDRAKADAVLANPSSVFPFMNDAEEVWNGLAIPFSHHGATNWFRETEPAIRIAENDPGGTLVVMTSASFIEKKLTDVQYVIDTVSRFFGAREYFANSRGSIRSTAFLSCNEKDPITLTIWKDEESMTSAAYGEGFHHQQIMDHKNTPIFGRTSFTRLRLINTTGTWTGESLP